jgi:nucleotide-binding universal stress UspA family protein
LNVVNLQRFERLPALIEDATREGERLVQEGAKQICGADYEAFPKTSPGHPRSDFSCFAKEWGADLILVGSHGHGAVGRFLLESIAQGVLRTAPCSVEIVRIAPVASSPEEFCSRPTSWCLHRDCIQAGLQESDLVKPMVIGV